MAKIITITLNTAIDKILRVDNFTAGEVYKTLHDESYPAGKGVNVSRALSCMGERSVALGFVGRNDASYFDSIRTEFLHTDWTLIEGNTRTNITICDPQAHTETHIRVGSNCTDEQSYQDLLAKLARTFAEGDVVVFSGSLPQHLTTEQFCRLIGEAQRLGGRVVVDSSAAGLADALKMSPTLIKPNRKELAEILHRPLTTIEEINHASKQLADQFKIDYVCVSMGEEGVVGYDRLAGRSYHANLKLEATEELHTVGSGDSMVAGLSAALLRGEPLQEMLREGVACGVANLLTTAPGVISPTQQRAFKQQITIA